MAVLQLTICQAQGVTIGNRRPKITDFLPSEKKGKEPTANLAEAKLMVCTMRMEALQKKKKQNGKI